ncbi:MAG: hypothetical protein D6731_10850 [Planctomycetota bacterium]|nr:MAG: hypothetical protein D6731_10850 [Planctomycetota bacterium]
MSLLEKIKGLFSRGQLPEETRLLLSGVTDVAELRRGLDEIVTRNEVEARDIEREIEKLARLENDQKERIARGNLNKREKTNTLREIQRLRRRMNSLEKRHRIHQDNIDLHLGLFDRITEMEAMELKRVTQEQIEEIAVDYDERYERHKDIMHAASAAAGLEVAYEDSQEQAELAALEREILAEAGALDSEAEQVAQAPPETDEAAAPGEDPRSEPTEEASPDPIPRRPPIEEELAELRREEPDEPALEVE